MEGKIEGMGRRGRRHQQLLGTLRKREGMEKRYIALLGEFTLEEGLLQDRLLNEWCVCVCVCVYIGLCINNIRPFPRVTGDGDKVGLQNVGH